MELGLGHLSLDPATFIGKSASNDVVITDDMADHVSLILDYVNTNFPAPRGLEIEVQLQTRKGRAIKGRCDIAAFHQLPDHLTIPDLKYGWKIVNPENNTQLLIYAGGVIAKIIAAGHQPPKTIELIIMQPRPSHHRGPFRRWVIAYDELLQRLEKILDAADRTYDEPNTFVPGPWCGDCVVAPKCEALRNAGLRIIDQYVGKTMSTDVAADQLGRELEIIRRCESILQDRKEAVEHVMGERIRKGEIFPHWSVQQTYSRDEWRDKQAAIGLGVLFGISIAKIAPFTPNQAIKAGIPETVVRKVSGKRPTGMKLINEDVTERAKRVFQHGKQ